MKNLVGALTIGTVLVGGAMVISTEQASACEYPEARVNTVALNVRSGHGTNYPKIAKFYRGDKVSILEMKPFNGFIKVAKGSVVGYVSVNYLQMLDTDINHIEEWVNKENGFYQEDDSHKELVTEPYKARTTANVNFRKSKEIRNDNKIQVIRKYSEVTVLSTSYDGKWARVKYLGKEGFVSTSYIKAI